MKRSPEGRNAQRSGEGSPHPKRHGLRSLEDARTLAGFVHNLKEGVYITRADGLILDANPAFLEMFGLCALKDLRRYTAAQLLVHPERRAEELAILQREGAVREFELQIRTPDGRVRTVLDTAYQVTDPDTGQVLYHGILVDITDRKELEEQLRQMAIRDPLTGCFNRFHLHDLERTLEAGPESWGVVVVDIDHFKDYNDRFGHHVGDRVLVQVGRFLCDAVRPDDAVIRTGGDEFVVLMPGADNAVMETIAERLRQKGTQAAPVSFTLGRAVREGREGLEDTVRRADHALIEERLRTRGRSSPETMRVP